MKFIALASAALLMTAARAQAVLEPAAKTIKCGKAEITCLLISPKGDRILVGTADGADLMDLETGKRIHHFDFLEDKSNVVYHLLFNDNGEYAMLAGFSGKRQVYDVKTGKKEGSITPFRWVPNSLAMKDLGLKTSNSSFDRFYTQETAQRGEITAKADKNGVVVFTNKESAAIQTLTFPENKDQHHRAPCLFNESWFITGTDDGRVLFYTLR